MDIMDRLETEVTITLPNADWDSVSVALVTADWDTMPHMQPLLARFKAAFDAGKNDDRHPRECTCDGCMEAYQSN